MEDFNSDERFLVPDSEDEDLNSREPWDLISGLQALNSHKSDCGLQKSQAMSSPYKKVFPSFDASQSADESTAKNAALAYDTISSDLDSGESSHNQTVIKRPSAKDDATENPLSTPSETIANLQFSQDVVLVPETLDSMDVVVSSPKDSTAPFIVPDSPSQEQEDKSSLEEVGNVSKALSSSTNSQSSNKLDSQGLYLHFSQSQQESSQTQGSLDQAEAMYGDRGLVTTPVKDPSLSLSCRKLSLRDAPPSPQRREPLPKPSFYLPSNVQLTSTMADKNEGKDDAVKGQTKGLTFPVQEEPKRSKKKQSRKHRLFMDTEEEFNSKGQDMSVFQNMGEVSGEEKCASTDIDEEQKTKGGKADGLNTNRNVTVGGQPNQPQNVASMVFTEESVSEMMDMDQTISYEFNLSRDQSYDGHRKNENGNRPSRSKEESQSHPDFDGFDDGDAETIEHEIQIVEKSQNAETEENDVQIVGKTGEDVETIEHEMQEVYRDSQDKRSGKIRADSPLAPSSQIRSQNAEVTMRERKITSFAPSELSTITDSLNPDPYQFKDSQSQNVADVSNLAPTDKSRSIHQAGSRTKAVKVMRKVLKKKMPLKKDQKSSSTDESTSVRSSRSKDLKPKLSTVKGRCRSTSKRQEDNSKKSSGIQQDASLPAESYTTIQSRLSNVTDGGNSQSASNVMPPPPLSKMEGARKRSMASNDTSPVEINKLNKKSTTVSFQEEILSKAAKERPESFGEIERKTVREFRALVVEREITVDILDDKGNILKQTITKEVTRTPVEPSYLAIDVRVTERVLSPNVSPSRSVSTLTSGDLADVSSSSLSRSISSGSKGSNPSLEFGSQSYPTPAQRSHTVETESSKAGPSAAGMAPKTSTGIPHGLAKQDSKRSSSGSNTGQDLFGSPDMSLIPHCSGNNLNRPASGVDSPSHENNRIPLSTVAQAQDVTTGNKNQSGKAAENIHESVAMAPNLDNETSSDILKDGRTEGLSNVDKPQLLGRDTFAVSLKGRGKRKIEERVEVKNTKLGKKFRHDKDINAQEVDEDQEEGAEQSGSSVSTGFVVQEVVTTAQTSSHNKATTKRKEKEDLSLSAPEPMSTNIGDAVTFEIKSKLLVGEQVMGKWTDGCYYPGTLKKMDSVNMRYQLKFDDGSQRWVGPDGLLLAKELPIGQSVMVLADDEYYLCGMIMDHSWTTDDPDHGQEVKEGTTAGNILMYHVERDDGVTQKCLRKCLLLSEDQASCLISDHNLMLPHDMLLSMVTPKKGDISLDNLVEGKRQHRVKGEKASGNESVTSGKKPVKVVGGGEETPTVSNETGVTRTGRRRKLGPVATSTPTPKQTSTAPPQYVGTPLKTSTSTDKLGSVMSSPSVSRKSYRKTRQVLFGKKLTPPCDLFKGYMFLLTHIEKSEGQRQEEKHLLDDSSLEDTSLDDNGEQGSNEEPHPFIKDQLQSLIVAGGGNVLDKLDMEEIQESGLAQCYLVASEHQRTVKYLQALASNIRIVSHQWILHSIDQGRLLNLKAFLLPAGISLEKRKLMECKSACSHLRGRTILVVSSRNDFVEAWSSILSLAKCHLPTRFPARAVKADPGIDYVVSDTTCPTAIVRKCHNLDVPLVSTEWVAQCLINNSLVDPKSHPKFRHDYDS